MFSLFDEIEEAEEVCDRTVSASALKEVRDAGMVLFPKRTAKYVNEIVQGAIEYEDAQDEKIEHQAMLRMQDAALALAEGE